MIFLTSGTGMGGGLVLNGKLYEGASGDAGEIGHVRLAPDGPVGFGKAGSVEGFCSGGGIARLASMRIDSIKKAGGQLPAWCAGFDIAEITARHVDDAARAGDAFALDIMSETGRKLAATLAILIDLINPERIVLGGFYPKSRALLEPVIEDVLARETLATARAACRILPAELGETIGSHGAIAAALHGFGE